MKNTIIKIILFATISLNIQMRCTTPDDIIVEENKTKILKHNYIIVNSANNTPAQVEVSYSVFVAGNTENIVKTETLTTPFIFGGEEVKVTYDSLHLAHRGRVSSKYTSLKRNYSPKGAEYLSIKNLSPEMLEYSIIGNNKVAFDNQNFVSKTPLPIYKGVPTLYLFKPDEGKFDNVSVVKYEGAAMHTKRMSLKAPNIGDITLTAPYTLQEIIALYREEDTNGKTLYSSLEDYVNNRKSMGKNNVFGYIQANKTLNNSGQLWFLNLHGCFWNYEQIDVND